MAFGKKIAAPFVKGGGRDQTHPNNHKGEPRKKGAVAPTKKAK